MFYCSAILLKVEFYQISEILKCADGRDRFYCKFLLDIGSLVLDVNDGDIFVFDRDHTLVYEKNSAGFTPVSKFAKTTRTGFCDLLSCLRTKSNTPYFMLSAAKYFDYTHELFFQALMSDKWVHDFNLESEFGVYLYENELPEEIVYKDSCFYIDGFGRYKSSVDYLVCDVNKEPCLHFLSTFYKGRPHVYFFDNSLHYCLEVLIQYQNNARDYDLSVFWIPFKYRDESIEAFDLKQKSFPRYNNLYSNIIEKINRIGVGAFYSALRSHEF